MDLLSAGMLLILTVCGLSDCVSAGYPKKGEHLPVPDEVVCGSAVPPHGEPQNSSAPYTITISENVVKPGDSVEVTISSNTPDHPIRGLVLTAKCGENILGSFNSDSLDIDLRNCDGVENSGVLYIDMKRRGIPEADLTWTAPFDVQCHDVRFHATIVKNYLTYWTDQISTEPLTISESGQPIVSVNELEDIWW